MQKVASHFRMFQKHSYPHCSDYGDDEEDPIETCQHNVEYWVFADGQHSQDEEVHWREQERHFEDADHKFFL